MSTETQKLKSAAEIAAERTADVPAEVPESMREPKPRTVLDVFFARLGEFPKRCPFCGQKPSVYPCPLIYPEVEEIRGGPFGRVKCENPKCAAQPEVTDGKKVRRGMDSRVYIQAAIKRWNKDREWYVD